MLQSILLLVIATLPSCCLSKLNIEAWFAFLWRFIPSFLSRMVIWKMCEIWIYMFISIFVFHLTSLLIKIAAAISCLLMTYTVICLSTSIYLSLSTCLLFWLSLQMSKEVYISLSTLHQSVWLSICTSVYTCPLHIFYLYTNAYIEVCVCMYVCYCFCFYSLFFSCLATHMRERRDERSICFSGSHLYLCFLVRLHIIIIIVISVLFLAIIFVLANHQSTVSMIHLSSSKS